MWASKLSLTDGRREREAGSCRQKERATVLGPVSLLTSFFDSRSTDPVATMKPAFVSIDSLTGSSSTGGSLILSTCHE